MITDPDAGTRIWSPGQRVRLVGMRRDLTDGPTGVVVREGNDGTVVRWDRGPRGNRDGVEIVHADSLEAFGA